MAQQKAIRIREFEQIVSLSIYDWTREMTSPQDPG